MARLLQQLLAPFEPIEQHLREQAARAAAEDDLALGCECANPALQFEAWEPSLLPQQGPVSAY
jgi:hypothetical protein